MSSSSTRYHITPEGKKLVTLIPGDGTGPEIIEAVRRIVEASGASIDWEERLAGAKVFEMGHPSGVLPETIESVKKTRVVLKGPLETPVGFGEKSANVTLRKLFETFANVRPVRELPGVKTPYSGRGIDLVVVRENIEDLYAAIEFMDTPGAAEAVKLITRKGCEKIARLAFELARAEGRKSVACATKSNILKFTEGTMKRTFEEVAKEYEDIESWHIIVDNCAHQLVKRPEQFDVILTTNMNGDILSDLTSALTGGLGFAPSANLGNDFAIFEAVHGSAPKYAGKNVINPSAVLLSATMMLRYLDEFEAASAIENALAKTLEDGIATRDVAGDEKGAKTDEFADAVISNLGSRPEGWKPRTYRPFEVPRVSDRADFVRATEVKTVGVDIFIESARDAKYLGERLGVLADGTGLELSMISSRGTQVFPPTGASLDVVDLWQCRFKAEPSATSEEVGVVGDEAIAALVAAVSAEFRWVRIQRLVEIDGEAGYTKAQGED
jgi:isocitrate dehydrogenase